MQKHGFPWDMGLNAAPTRSINIVQTTTPLLDPTKQVAGVHSTSNGVHVLKTRCVQIRISLFYCSYKYYLLGYSVSGIKGRNSLILYCVKCILQAYCKNAATYELCILPERLPCIIRICSNHLQREVFFNSAYFFKCTRVQYQNAKSYRFNNGSPWFIFWSVNFSQYFCSYSMLTAPLRRCL
jgi:hypothetical protein